MTAYQGNHLPQTQSGGAQCGPVEHLQEGKFHSQTIHQNWGHAAGCDFHGTRNLCDPDVAQRRTAATAVCDAKRVVDVQAARAVPDSDMAWRRRGSRARRAPSGGLQMCLIRATALAICPVITSTNCCEAGPAPPRPSLHSPPKNVRGPVGASRP